MLAVQLSAAGRVWAAWNSGELRVHALQSRLTHVSFQDGSSLSQIYPPARDPVLAQPYTKREEESRSLMWA